MGNRLSQHEVQKIELIHSPVEEQEDEPAALETETIDSPVNNDASASDLTSDVEEDKEEEQEPENTDTESDEEPEIISASESDGSDDESAPEIIPEVQLESSKEPESAPVKKVDFEITNPDDLDIDDKGQFGLF